MSVTPIPDPLRWEVWARDDFRCLSCASRMFLVVDHVLPEAYGGLTTFGNLQTLCQPCNSRKSDHITAFIRPGEKCTASGCWCRKVERAPSNTVGSRWKIPPADISRSPRRDTWRHSVDGRRRSLDVHSTGPRSRR